jgi:predicted nucleic acid-binding Zn ribbon protein
MHAQNIRKQKNVTYMYFGIMTLIAEFVALNMFGPSHMHYNTFKTGWN